jgi:hypothetical protein
LSVSMYAHVCSPSIWHKSTWASPEHQWGLTGDVFFCAGAQQLKYRGNMMVSPINHRTLRKKQHGVTYFLGKTCHWIIKKHGIWSRTNLGTWFNHDSHDRLAFDGFNQLIPFQGWTLLEFPWILEVTIIF